MLISSAASVVRQLLPTRVRRWLGVQRRNFSVWPPAGWVRFGSMRRVKPVSPIFGLDRGTSIDRYYIEAFLADRAGDIRGDVLEVADRRYTVRFGGDQVRRSEVLHVSHSNPIATLVADLSADNDLPSDRFDCIVCTQTLQFIYDTRAAVHTLHRILKPGGILLATFPGISQISRYDAERWGDYWRFTTQSAERLFSEVFASANVNVESHGNVLAAGAMLQGLAVEDLRQGKLGYRDPDYQLVITVRAVKSWCPANKS